MKKPVLLMLLALFLGSLILSQALASESIIVLAKANDYQDQRLLPAFESAVKKVLIQKGVVVLEPEQLSAVREKRLVDQLLRGDTEAAIQLGMTYQADWILVAQVESSLVISKNVGPVTAYTYKAVADASVISASTAQVVLAERSEGIGIGTSKKEAISKAFTEAGRAIGKKVAEAIAKSAGNRSLRITLTVAGLQSFSDAATLLKEIRRIPGVLDAERKNYRNGVLEALITYQGNVDDLAAALENLPLTKLRLTEIEGHSITAEVVE